MIHDAWGPGEVDAVLLTKMTRIHVQGFGLLVSLYFAVLLTGPDLAFAFGFWVAALILLHLSILYYQQDTWDGSHFALLIFLLAFS